MNSIARVHRALRLQQPDRVPIVEFVIDEKVARAAVRGCKDAFDAMDQLDMDGVACGAQFEKITVREDGYYTDEWGVTYKSSSEAISHPIRGPIISIEDAKAYRPPAADAPIRLSKLNDIVRRYKGKRAVLFHHRAAFMWSAYLMGLDNLLANLILQPRLAEIVMDKVLETNMEIVRRAIRAGAEVIVLGDDYAHNKAPLMSPQLFKRFILPRLARMIDMIHAEGALCIKHSDGNIYPLLAMIADTVPDGINPIEPVAGMRLKEVKRLVGQKMCIVGNIDCAWLLPRGSPEEVRTAVRQAILDAGKDGGYILSSSNSIHSSCKAENLIAMVKACKEFGVYS